MLRSKVEYPIIVAIAFAIALQGCSSIGSRLSPGVGGSAFRAGSARIRATARTSSGGAIAAQVYATDVVSRAIDIYSQKSGALVGQITGLHYPQGVTTDSQGNLYVADQYCFCVLVYPYGQSNPSLTLSEGSSSNGYLPVGISVRNGKVAVANQESVPSFGPGNLAFFKPGASVPYLTVTPSFAYFVTGDAFDNEGNLFFTAADPSGSPVVGEIKKGAKVATNLNLTGFTSQNINGVQMDKNGNLLVMDSGAVTLDIFAPGSQTPTSQIAMHPPVSLPYSFALNQAQTKVWVADYSHNQIFSFSYPGGALKQTITMPYGASPAGIAVTPRAAL